MVLTELCPHSVQLFLEHLSGQWHHHHPGQPIPVLDATLQAQHWNNIKAAPKKLRKVAKDSCPIIFIIQKALDYGRGIGKKE